MSVLTGDDLAEAVDGVVREPFVDAGREAEAVVAYFDFVE
jgi:hypothetical protein